MKPWVRQWLIALGVALFVAAVASVLSVLNNTTFGEPAVAINPLVPAVLLGVVVACIIAAVHINPRWRVWPLLVLPAGMAGIGAVFMWRVVDDPCPLSPGLATDLNSVPPDPCAGFAIMALTLAVFAVAMLVTATYRRNLERRPAQMPD